MEKRQTELVPIEETPEVKSFIYQQIVDFEPFLTPTSLVSVVSKNAENLSGKKSKTHHQIQISIKEDDVSIFEVGSSENIYEAIIEAKNKLFRKLISIQDSVISEQDRVAQIKSIKSGQLIH